MSQNPASQTKRPRLDIFKVDPTAVAADDSLGLRSAITSHLQGTPPSGPMPTRSWQSPSVRQAQGVNPASEAGKTNQLRDALAHATYLSKSGNSGQADATEVGTQLNHVDAQAASGIEHLLPTPSIRYKVVEERLSREIQALEAKLTQYLNIAKPTPAMQRQIYGLQVQYETLKEHRAQVQQQLAQLYPEGEIAFTLTHQIQFVKRQVSQSTQQSMAALSPVRLIRSTRPEVQSLVEGNTQITQLADLLEAQLRQPGASAETLSQVINQLDHQILQVDRQAQQLRSRQSWRDKANAVIHQWLDQRRDSAPIGLVKLKNNG
jgi:hypothetical protein